MKIYVPLLVRVGRFCLALVPLRICAGSGSLINYGRLIVKFN